MHKKYNTRLAPDKAFSRPNLPSLELGLGHLDTRAPRNHPEERDLRFDFVDALLWIVVVAGAGAKFAFVNFDFAEFIEIEATPGTVGCEAFRAVAANLEEQSVFAVSLPTKHMRTEVAWPFVIHGRDQLLLDYRLLDHLEDVRSRCHVVHVHWMNRVPLSAQ
jgi:hypothetical protein